VLRRRRPAKPLFDVAPGATLTIAPDAVVGAGSRFHVHEGATVVVGAGTRFGERCVVAAHERVEIGAGCVLGDNATVMDFEPGAADPERPIREQGLVTAPVRIGDRAILDRGACVLAGATIAPGARVATHSVATRPGV
jgi:acetyltransferase-like isoleucine patch superfamily enzyme